ncbi:MAG: 50S ribosomal protein L29 [Dehalococcoidia bacterium]|nr:MAG: 50S ribosomal protein L29 [Dehalococcoidia bacterium]
MKLDEVRAMGEGELKKQLEDSRQELFNLRFRLATKQLVNHREIPRVKKKIARLETIIREKALAEVEEKA